MRIVLTGYATVESHFVSRKHVEQALAADGHEVLSTLPKDCDAAVAQGTRLEGKPTSILKLAENKGIEVLELGELISTPKAKAKAKAAMKASLEAHKGSLDQQKLRALEVLQSERKQAVTSKKRRTNQSSCRGRLQRGEPGAAEQSPAKDVERWVRAPLRATQKCRSR